MPGAVGLIFSRDKEVLLVKRRDVPIWVLPGGGVESNETPEQAVKREVYEETGFRVEIVRKIAEYLNAKGNNVTHMYECRIISGEKTLSKESQAIKYFKTDDLPELIFPFIYLMIEDAIKNEPEVIKKQLEKLPSKFWLKSFKHPYVAFKFLLTRIGIHWNEK